jgi:NAD-dependent deacetylase
MKKKHLVILSGAGISKESGIDTFRDNNGLWKKNDALKLASVEGWNTDPQAVLDFYNARRRQLLEVQPNKAHRLLAALEEQYDVTIITQNVDDLHERAGSTHVIHLHGELAKVCSSHNKEDAECIEQRPLSDDIHLGDTARDGSQLRPYIVWFGEDVPLIKEAMNTAFSADIFVVTGTSLLVSPANILTACSGAGHNIVIDPGEVDIPEGYLHIREAATTGVEMLYDSLVRLSQSSSAHPL